MNTMHLGPDDQGPDTKRLLTAVVAATVLVLVWQTFFVKPLPPPVPEEVATTEPRAPSAEQAPAGPAAPPAADLVAATPRQLPESTTPVEADVAAAQAQPGRAGVLRGGYRAELSNVGGQLRSFSLTAYQDPQQPPDAAGAHPPVDLASGSFEGARLVALRTRGGDVELRPDDAYELSHHQGREATYTRLTAAGVRVTRSYVFDADRFGFVHEVTLKNESSQPRTAALDVLLVAAERAGERDEGGAFAPGTDQLGATCRAGGEQDHWLSSEVEEPERFDGQVRYAGIDRHFFLATLLPESGVPTQGCRVTAWQRGDGSGPNGRGLVVAVEQSELVLAPGASQTWRYRAYFGPKQLQALQEVGADLEENIQFGWFGVLSRPMLWFLVWLYEHIGNFGLAIILLTIMMKALTFPLTQKSYVSMQQMKVVAPEMKKLQEKYGNDRAMLGQKQMEMYKEKGVNPMAGCFPVLVQMPIWFALYRTLWNSVELYQQPFYWSIADLSQPDHILFGFPLLPILVGALMLVQTLMQPPPQDQPQMKYVMWGMPVMFTFFMLQMPSGLSLYMITNSMLTMAQQFYIKRKYA